MSTEQATPLTALWRHKRLTAVLVLVAVAAGVGLGLTRPTLYTAEARLAVGGNAGLAAESVPGFALATQQLAANYARYVNNAQQQSALESQLGIRSGTVEDVSASPIPESNVVRLEVTARTAAAARVAVGATTDSLLEQVNDTTRVTSAADDTLSQYTDISNQVAAAQQTVDAAQAALGTAQGTGQGDVPQLRQASADAAAQLAILQVQQQAIGQKYRNQISELSQGAANLIVVQKPAVTGDDQLSRLSQYGLAGLVAGLLLALLVSVLREGRSARPRVVPEDELGPALGHEERRVMAHPVGGAPADAGERVQ
jgi:hypothetical protein